VVRALYSEETPLICLSDSLLKEWLVASKTLFKETR